MRAVKMTRCRCPAGHGAAATAFVARGNRSTGGLFFSIKLGPGADLCSAHQAWKKSFHMACGSTVYVVDQDTGIIADDVVAVLE
jgi:hypothetical protein